MINELASASPIMKANKKKPTIQEKVINKEIAVYLLISDLHQFSLS